MSKQDLTESVRMNIRELHGALDETTQKLEFSNEYLEQALEIIKDNGASKQFYARAKRFLNDCNS